MQDLQDWSEAMYPVFNEAVFSGLELHKGAVGSKVQSHVVLIEAVWVPTARKVFDRFKILSANVATVKEVKRRHPGILPSQAQQIREFEKRDAASVVGGRAMFGRSIVEASGTGVNKGLKGGGWGMITRTPEGMAKGKAHDPDWVKTLKETKEMGGYMHE
ncbi:hypothetical protein RQP46_002254 [Phenoliferia psychrophenolica]